MVWLLNLPLVCFSIERIYVDAAIHDEFVERLVERARRIELSMLVASLEATSGSVMAKAERILPASRGLSHCSRCSAVP